MSMPNTTPPSDRIREGFHPGPRRAAVRRHSVDAGETSRHRTRLPDQQVIPRDRGRGRLPRREDNS